MPKEWALKLVMLHIKYGYQNEKFGLHKLNNHKDKTWMQEGPNTVEWLLSTNSRGGGGCEGGVGVKGLKIFVNFMTQTTTEG